MDLEGLLDDEVIGFAAQLAALVAVREQLRRPASGHRPTLTTEVGEQDFWGYGPKMSRTGPARGKVSLVHLSMLFRRCVAAVAVGVLLGALPGYDARAEVPVLVLDGKGFGHGVGLSQWGAEHLARNGRSAADILATFYPGTSLVSKGGQVRVAVFTSPNGTTTLQFPNGGEVRSSLNGAQAAGFPVRVGPGGRVRITFNGSYVVEPLATGQSGPGAQRYRSEGDQPCITLVNCPTTTSTTAPGGGGCIICTTTTTAPTATTTPLPGVSTTTAPSAPPGSPPPPPSSAPSSGSPVWAVPNGSAPTSVAERGRSYRGVLEATAGAGPLRLINQLDVETYLKGLGEVPSSWPVQAIAAQSIAARTYALRAMSFSGEICDYDLCQVYLGAGREAASQNAAVDATRATVLTYRGHLASAVYSSSAGGVSANTLEGFGTPAESYPYLTTVRYETDNPQPWHSEVSMADVAARFGYRGTVARVAITKAGPSGRALEVTLDGTAGPMVVDGRRFASGLGLRSTLFVPATGSSAVAPPAPGGLGQVQALPEDTAAITAAATAGEQGSDAARDRLRDRADRALDALEETDLLRDGASDLATDPRALAAALLIAAATAYACAITERQRGALDDPTRSGVH